MNGRNRHNKYRKGVYRRKNISSIIIISVICFILFATAFFIIGNLLKTQSDKRHENETYETESTPDKESQNDKASVRSILAHPVFLETQGVGTFSTRLDALTSSGVYEASVPLNTANGELLFKSSVAEKIGYSTGNANIKLSSALPYAQTKNIYLSGIFFVTAFNIEDPLVRSVELSRQASLVAEALNAGFDDVLLIAPSMTNDHIDDAIRFIDDIKALTNGGTVGLCISDNILSSDNSQYLSETIDLLNSKIDFLAIDLSGTDISNGVDAISESISPIQHYILMYKMRVILPNDKAGQTLTSIISEAESNGIKNIQIMP